MGELVWPTALRLLLCCGCAFACRVAAGCGCIAAIVWEVREGVLHASKGTVWGG